MAQRKRTSKHLSSSPHFFVFFFFWGVVRVVHLFCLLCCPIMCRYVLGSVSYDFCIKTMFNSSLLPLFCRRTHVLFTLLVFCFAHSGFQHILCWVFVLFFLYSRFLWIVHLWLPLRCPLIFIWINVFVQLFVSCLVRSVRPIFVGDIKVKWPGWLNELGSWIT